ncbi:hypothetical protein [Anabaena azotica]|uniref:hypothetical protein n=1 Tax=Anabaena azotica TaxID=197653 RepID=UPI0039A6A246
MEKLQLKYKVPSPGSREQTQVEAAGVFNQKRQLCLNALKYQDSELRFFNSKG